MVVQLSSGDVHGIDGRVVEVEVDVFGGMQSFAVTGLAGKGIRESKERIRSAIQNSGFTYPIESRVVVNLVPTDWESEGCLFHP